jgi:diguanylate cyclase (GGDEF)-like protein
MITAGDFTQRIDFMGEFAQSINAMVTQLDQTLQEVAKKDKELSKANAELLKEISIRKQTEAALREREEAFKQLAITDPLTGLYNRRHFNHLAEIEISRVLRYSRPLSIVMFDIDFFKRVNDAFGHASGDMVLQVVANTITENVRATDIPSRYGGEEFIILFPETTAADAEKIAETLRKTIEAATIPGENGSIAITASFGVNDYFEKADARSPEKVLREFINRADRAMYASKNAGRNRVTIYNPDEETAP